MSPAPVPKQEPRQIKEGDLACVVNDKLGFIEFGSVIGVRAVPESEENVGSKRSICISGVRIYGKPKIKMIGNDRYAFDDIGSSGTYWQTQEASDIIFGSRQDVSEGLLAREKGKYVEILNRAFGLGNSGAAE